MQTKTKEKRPTRRPTIANKINRGLRSTRKAVAKMTAALSKPLDTRPITIIGRDPAGNIVAEDRHDAHWKTGQVAAAWKASGLTVEVIETGHPNGPIPAGAGGRPEPAGSI